MLRMVGGAERLPIPGLADERVGARILATYLIVWAGLTAGALFLWPDVVEIPGVKPWSALPLLIVPANLRRRSAAAWTWCLAFHGSVSVGVTALGVARAALNEVDPFLIAYGTGLDRDGDPVRIPPRGSSPCHERVGDVPGRSSRRVLVGDPSECPCPGIHLDYV